MNAEKPKCQICGQFIKLTEMDKKGGASACFVPDSEFTYEETTFRCAADTKKHGLATSPQNVDSSKLNYSF